MTDEKREIPYIKIIHPIFDEIRKARYLTFCEKDILWCIVAYTIGFNRPFYNMSYSYIAKDIGYSERIVKKGLSVLETRNMIINHKNPNSKINRWGINPNITSWNREPQFPQEIKAKKRNREPQFPQEIKDNVLFEKSPMNREPQFPIGSEPQFPIGSEPQFPQEIKNINKNILNKKEKTNNEKLFQELILKGG